MPGHASDVVDDPGVEVVADGGEQRLVEKEVLVDVGGVAPRAEVGLQDTAGAALGVGAVVVLDPLDEVG